MDEDKGETDKKPTDAKEDTGAGTEAETITELDRADQIAERQKRENDRREELLIREEKLEARKIVGGKSEAGKEPEKPKEISDIDYARQAAAGELNAEDKKV